MPALDGYTRRGQRNPWGRPFYGQDELGGLGGPTPITPNVYGPFVTSGVGLEYYCRTTDCKVGFDQWGDPTPDWYIDRSSFEATTLPEPDKVEVRSTMQSFNCWL